MRLSYNWLKEFVDIDINPYQLKDALTSCGLKVERVSRMDDLNDTVLEIEITSNRPDLLSMIGIGREVAAIVRKPLKLPDILEDNSGADEVLAKTLAKIAIESNKCKRYTARIINDVKVSGSPRWLANRLASMGLRTINNVVDITNFVMMEHGQPLHGFDYDKIKGGKIVVRLAQKGERIVTIDGVERNLDEETLVICDAERPLAIAGIMGGKDTEVTDATKRVLLESAYFDPVSIRKTARRLGISSESSYRFERGVDLMGVPLASLRAALLMKRIASGKPSKDIADRGKRDVTIKSIYLETEKVNDLLGTRIKEGEIIRLLKAISFRVSKEKRGYTVTVPHHRQDIRHDVDLIEEVARLYGYDKIPTTLPKSEIRTSHKDSSIELDCAVRESLSASGLHEALTYSLISYGLLQKIRYNIEGIIKIKNPMSIEQEIMRPTLLPGIISVVSHNIKRKLLNVKIYELGRVYRETGENNFEEQRALAIAVTGERYNNWQMKSRAVDFFDLKGIISLLLKRIGIVAYDFISYKEEDDFVRPFKCYEGLFNRAGSSIIIIGDKPVGIIGNVRKEVLAGFDITDEVYAGELKLLNLAYQRRAEKRYREIVRYPYIKRDVAVVIDRNIQARDVEQCVKESGGDLINSIILFDQYIGNQVPAGHRSLAFSIEYLAKDRTLTDDEVKEIHTNVLKKIEEKFKAAIR